MIAPPARIRRRTGWELTHAARLSLNVSRLVAGGPISVDALRDGLSRSPWYLDRLRALGLAPRDLRSVEDLAHFPTMDRATLGRAWDALPALDEDLVVVMSSGTTGEAVRVVRDGYDTIYMWGVLRFWLERLGIALPPRPRVVLADSLPGGLEYSVRLPLVERGALHRISLTRGDAIDRIRRVRPSAIFTDPAGLHALPSSMGASVLFSSAQRLDPSIVAKFDAPVVDYYSTTETGPIAWRVGASGPFVTLAPDVWIESVDGELAVTRLRASALPVVRYLTGDRGVLDGQTIVSFDGREACRFTTPLGESVDAWQLAWLFKHHPLDAFRLVQTGARRFRLELDRDAPGLDAQLAAALDRMGFGAVEIAHAPLVRRGTKHRPFSVDP